MGELPCWVEFWGLFQNPAQPIFLVIIRRQSRMGVGIARVVGRVNPGPEPGASGGKEKLGGWRMPRPNNDGLL